MPNTTQRRSVRPAAKNPRATASRRSNTPNSKLDQVEAALRTAKGATITNLMKLTGWQNHSVRGAIAGALKKKRGLTVISEKIGDERVYRIGAKP